MAKVWFITGTSKGFGRIWAEAALGRGDKVAATARDTETLTGLVDRSGDHVLPIALDVTDKPAVDRAVRQAHDHFGASTSWSTTLGTACSGRSRRSPRIRRARRSRPTCSEPCG